MKKMWGFAALVLAGSACQQHTPVAKAALIAKATVIAARPAYQLAAKPDTPALVATPTKAAPTAALAPAAVLQQFDLSVLWQGKYDEEKSQSWGPMDGFFGRDYRRIAFAFTEIHRDSLRPAVYWVKGKDRFQKVVSSFEGTLTIKSIAHLPPGVDRQEVDILDVEDLSSVFMVKAAFEFREQPASGTTGVFTGTGYLDFFLDSADRMHSAISMMEASPLLSAKGAGVLYTGQWVGYHTKYSQPLVVSGNVFITAPVALSHFSIGDRDPSFNPSYAKLGWNDYWTNDEWWADSPKPALGL